MQEQSKASLPRAAAVCPLDSSVPTGPSLVSSLTMADIEAVIQMVAFPHLLFGKVSPQVFYCETGWFHWFSWVIISCLIYFSIA